MLPGGLSFLGLGDSNKVEEVKNEALPSLNLRTDRDVYRPGDTVDITIEISNPEVELGSESNVVRSLLVERITFEMKGIEKLDVQWFATQKPLPGSRQRRGEHVFVESSTPLILLNRIISSGVTRTYLVRTSLPSIIPPSYKGATIRYIYHVRSTLSAQWLVLENGNSRTETVKKLTQVEARIPLQVWVSQKANGLQIEGGQNEDIVPETTIQMDLCWKEIDADSDWVRANDIYDGGEEGYESSRDEVSSVSSYNVTKENMHKAFGSSLSLQSSVARSSNRDSQYLEGGRTSMSSYVAIPQLSVAEVLYEPNADTSSVPQSIISPRHQQKHLKPFSSDDNGGSSVPEHVEPIASEGFIRGRSYNIRLDDQVLLRFSPKNSDSTYYFSDMIGGTLTFFHEEGARRCLEVSITLETSETIDRRHVHPSRRNSPTITKVQSDYHEVVADLVQTSFLFSIPTDGPMSFSTPRISVQWSLRFEFLTTPKNVDWTRYDHPLLVENREKTEWVLPIIVHAPPPGNSTTAARNDKSFFLEPLWALEYEKVLFVFFGFQTGVGNQVACFINTFDADGIKLMNS